MFEDLTRLLVLLFAFGIGALWIVGRYLAAMIEHWRLHRAIELRMEERLALVARGINPQTLAPLHPRTSGESPGV